jgi:hypothetical protein
LLSIEDHSAPDRKMWQPDGSEVSAAVRSVLTNGWSGSSAGVRWFSVLVSNAPDDSLIESWAARVGREQLNRFGGLLKNSPPLGGTIVHFATTGAGQRTSAHVRFGFAVKPWRTLLVWEGRPLNLVRNNWPGAGAVEEIDVEDFEPRRMTDFNPLGQWTMTTSAGSEIRIKLPENKRSVGTWILEVTDRQGRSQILRGYRGVSNMAGDWNGETIWSVDVLESDIRAITLKGHFTDEDYHWTDFGDVPLQHDSPLQIN